MYKTETHSHTSESSPCGFLPAEQLVHLYKCAGFKTVIITDHACRYAFHRIECKPWDKKIDHLMKGYKKAKAHGDKIGVNVLFALETVPCDIGNDYILFGITEELLRATPHLHSMTIKDLVKFTQDNNIFMVQAHPARQHIIANAHEFNLGVEAYNGQYLADSRNASALEYATKHNLYMISGSDSHKTCDIARGGIITKTEIKTIADFINAVKSRDIELITSKD